MPDLLLHLRRQWFLLFLNNKESANLDIPNNKMAITTMVDISAAFIAIKETLGLLSVVNDAKSDYEIKAATSEIQNKLITLQNECFSLGDMVRAHEAQVISLKTKITEFENFEHKAEGYVLEQLESGSLVYSKKQTVNGKEITVHLCPNCFTRQVISILQPSEGHFYNAEKEQYFTQSYCHSCSSIFAIRRSSYDPMRGFPVSR